MNENKDNTNESTVVSADDAWRVARSAEELEREVKKHEEDVLWKENSSLVAEWTEQFSREVLESAEAGFYSTDVCLRTDNIRLVRLFVARVVKPQGYQVNYDWSHADAGASDVESRRELVISVGWRAE